MWASVASFIGKAVGAIGKNGASVTQRFLKQSISSAIDSTGRGITSFLNSNNTNQEQPQKQPSPVTSTLLPLALTNPAILIPLLVVLAVVAVLTLSFAFLVHIAPWPTGLSELN
jgi:hypothetical protein